MPRNISFSMTTPQVRNRTKDVTRRLGWKDAKPGDILQGVEKAMGLKKGEKIKKLALIRVVSNTPEPLNRMAKDRVYGFNELRREGYPFGCTTPEEFVTTLAKKSRISEDTVVNRIEFEYLD